MGTTKFFRQTQAAMPRILKQYFQGPDLILSGRRLHDCHFPRELQHVFESKQRLTLLGAAIDHNTMYYNLHASLFPCVRSVRMGSGIRYFEWHAYSLRKQAVWEFPEEFSKDEWQKGDFRGALESGAAKWIRLDAFSMKDVLREPVDTCDTDDDDDFNLLKWATDSIALPRPRCSFSDRDARSEGKSQSQGQSQSENKSASKTEPSVFLNNDVGWVARTHYEFWLQELFADPSLV